MKHLGIARDQELVDLYRKRNPQAIEETSAEYGKYLESISFRLLQNREDAEECVSDALLKAWNTIPPFLPNSLQFYLGKLVRTSSLDVYRKKNSAKRNHTLTTILSESARCQKGNPEEDLDKIVIGDCISAYLKEQSGEKQFLFVRRYYYGDSIKTLAEHRGMSHSHVKVTLHRMRKELKRRLTEEGVTI